MKEKKRKKEENSYKNEAFDLDCNAAMVLVTNLVRMPLLQCNYTYIFNPTVAYLKVPFIIKLIYMAETN